MGGLVGWVAAQVPTAAAQAVVYALSPVIWGPSGRVVIDVCARPRCLRPAGWVTPVRLDKVASPTEQQLSAPGSDRVVIFAQSVDMALASRG